MVGPGAGIAPFRGFVEEKGHLSKVGGNNVWGEMTLFFGCKARNWDYLYKEELLSYHENKVIENYHVAFSREQVLFGVSIF
jgi:Sulfite reductase, alpha subunit (flavoprotein)